MEKIYKMIFMQKNYVIIIIIMALSHYSCNKKQNINNSTSEKLVEVEVYVTRDTLFKPIYEFSASVESNKKADIGSSLPGRIEKIHVRKGQFVRVAQPLVSMSSELLIMAEVEYLTLLRDMERVTRLRERGSISEQEFDHVKAKYEAAKAKYDFFSNSTIIKAPFDGIVADIFMNEGEMYNFIPTVDHNLTIGRGILRIIQNEPLKIVFQVHESLLANVIKGKKIEVFSDVLDKPVEAIIDFISPELNISTNSARVEATLLKRADNLLPGMFCRIRLEGKNQKGCIVPVTSLIQKDGLDHLWIVEDSIVRLKHVEVLGYLDIYAFVKGITANQMVVISKKAQLKEESKVIPIIIK